MGRCAYSSLSLSAGTLENPDAKPTAGDRISVSRFKELFKFYIDYLFSNTFDSVLNVLNSIKLFFLDLVFLFKLLDTYRSYIMYLDLNAQILHLTHSHTSLHPYALLLKIKKVAN